MKRSCSFVICTLIAAMAPVVLFAASLDDLDAKSFDERNAAFKAFVKQGGDAVPTLITRGTDKRMLVRMYSAKARGVIGDPSAVDALKAATTKDGNPAIRAEAALALGSFHTVDVAQHLLVVSGAVSDKADVSRYVRLCAAQGLCKFRSKATMPAIIALLKHTDDDIPPIAAKTLTDITYFDFGTDYAKWKKWWGENKDTFKLTQSAYPHAPLEKE